MLVCVILLVPCTFNVVWKAWVTVDEEMIAVQILSFMLLVDASGLLIEISFNDLYMANQKQCSLVKIHMNSVVA